MGLLRTIISVTLLGALVYGGATVELGEKTLFGHVRAIWRTEETQSLVEGVKQESAPIVDKVTRGVKAGLDEVRRQPAAADAGRGATADAGVP
jgi:hypothetical protein